MRSAGGLTGWTWDALEAAWEEGFAHLQSSSSARGTRASPLPEDGYRLGQWVSDQRQATGRGRSTRSVALGWKPYRAGPGNHARQARMARVTGDQKWGGAARTARPVAPGLGCGGSACSTLLLSILVAAVGLGLLQGGKAVSSRAAAATTCGVERWAVKTLSDKRERLVNFKPHDSSIGRLRKKPHPDVGPNTKRIKGVETTNYRVAAQLIEMKLEDDHDIHLVISVPGSPAKTMIVEFPDTTCNGASSSPKKGEDGERPLLDHRGLRSAVLQPLHSPERQGDDYRRRVLRHSPWSDGRRTKRNRAAPGLEVRICELFELSSSRSAALHGKQRFVARYCAGESLETSRRFLNVHRNP